MLATWNYQPRNTFVQRLDPRARLIFMACFMVSVFMFWDLRILALFMLLTIAAILAARISWHDTSRTWIALGIFILFYALITLLTGRSTLINVRTEHIIFTLKAPITILGWQPSLQLSMEQIFLSLGQFARIFSIAGMTILLPFTLDPAQYGITFHRLGMPDKIAFAMDLTMRFVPSLSRDFAMTIDAQRARGYELENRQGGVVGQVRKLAPLLVPVVIHSIVNGEEITDAMDLRAFGNRPRTWLRELKYAPHDYILIGLSVLMLVVSVAASLLGYGGLWLPG
jgi:energy-coupling factor transport system permease protein